MHKSYEYNSANKSVPGEQSYSQSVHKLRGLLNMNEAIMSPEKTQMQILEKVRIIDLIEQYI